MPSRYEELRRALDTGALIESARAQAGLNDFGDESFLEPIATLLDCIARDVDLHAQGLEMLKASVVRCLVNRLRMQEDIVRHPEILDEDVSDPIIVIGMGRSGTTKLHSLLSVADDVQKTYFWRLWNPARFPDTVPGQPDPRIAAANFSEMLSDDKPELDAAHHIDHEAPDEEWMLYFYTFDDWGWCQALPTSSYFDWVMARSSLRPYRYVKQILQYLQWQDGGKRGRPWVLKTVGYIAHMDSLLDCYPNATLVHPHRDPRDTIPSYAKFLSGMAIYSNHVDPNITGRETLRWWKLAMDRYLDARNRLELNGRILDVGYEQVRNDPMMIVKAVYQKAGRTLSVDTEQKMAAWNSSHEQGKHGKHEYSLDEFGLTEAMVDSAFDEYISRFIHH